MFLKKNKNIDQAGHDLTQEIDFYKFNYDKNDKEIKISIKGRMIDFINSNDYRFRKAMAQK